MFVVVVVGSATYKFSSVDFVLFMEDLMDECMIFVFGVCLCV